MKRHSSLSNHIKDLRWFAGMFLLLCVGGCGSLQLASQWSDNTINVDGKSDEWTGKTEPMGSKKLTIGFANDTNYVYMMLSTGDRTMSRMLMIRGLNVWFDSAGGRNKTFGIHYPLGILSGRSTGGRGTQTDPLSALKGNTALSELEILGSVNDNRRAMPIAAAGGIQARINYSESSLVYELRVPYTTGERFPFSIQARSGSLIGVGLETPDMGSTAGGTGGTSGGTGGGRGRGGRGGTSSMGSEPERTQASVEPLNDWMKVQLMSPDSLRVK